MGISDTTGSSASADLPPRSRREARERTRSTAGSAVSQRTAQAVTPPRSRAGVEEVSSRRRVRRAEQISTEPPLVVDLTESADAAAAPGPSLPAVPAAVPAVVPVATDTPRPSSRRDARRAESSARPAGRRERAARQVSGAGRSRGPVPAPEEGARRRLGDRRVWGAALATAMVLLVPGTTLLSPRTPVQELALNSSGGNVYGTVQTEGATTQTAVIASGRPDSRRTRDSRQNRSSREQRRDRSTGTSTTRAPSAKPSASAPGTSAPGSTKPGLGTPGGTSPGTQPPNGAKPSSPSFNTVGKASGLPWSSGAFVAADSISKINTFGNWRGKGMDVVSSFSARKTWNDVINPSWLLQAWSGTEAIRSFGIPPIPEGEAASLQACAAGSYNDKWRTFGNNMKNSGFSDKIVIRLGWEFNGNWYKWQANDPAAFAGCWRQIVSTVEAIAPALRWDWNVNRGANSGQPDPAKAWPGDAYVDYVGVDSYDMWPGVKSEADWQKHYSGPLGLKYWADFARAHGKKLSVPEWGVYPGTASQGQNGGDNPLYIQKMIGFFEQQGDLMGYEAYFNEPNGYIASSLVGPVQNPNAANAYKQALASVR